VSERTVHKHLENIYDRLGATSRTQAVLTAWSISRGGDAPDDLD
jgi:DNA-binding NarL/FixJ family response regulator